MPPSRTNATVFKKRAQRIQGGLFRLRRKDLTKLCTFAATPLCSFTLKQELQNITELLAGHARGDKESLDQLMPIVYDELRRQAARYLRREQAGHTLQTTQKFDEVGHVALQPDGNGVIMPAKAHGASFVQIWQLFRDGSKRSITNDLSDYWELSLRADGSAFVTVQRQTLSRLWSLRKGETKATAIAPGTSRYFDLCATPDQKLIYASDASGMADIYEIGTAGGDPRPITSEGGRNYAPVVSPDNRYIAFHSNRAGVFQIWRADRDGARPKQLTFGPTESTWPRFSPDGQWIVYQHAEGDSPVTLWRVPIDGGSPERITDGVAIRATISPDGKLLAFWYNDQKGEVALAVEGDQLRGRRTEAVDQF